MYQNLSFVLYLLACSNVHCTVGLVFLAHNFYCGSERNENDDYFDDHDSARRNDTGKEVSCIATNRKGSGEASTVINVACRVFMIIISIIVV